MIQALQSLATNPRISAQDPILIYYAGHGSEAKLTSLFSGNTIQMLVPYDFVLDSSANHEGQGIFDVTLSSILNEIAREKSDNVVSRSILDWTKF